MESYFDQRICDHNNLMERCPHYLLISHLGLHSHTCKVFRLLQGPSNVLNPHPGIPIAFIVFFFPFWVGLQCDGLQASGSCWWLRPVILVGERRKSRRQMWSMVTEPMIRSFPCKLVVATFPPEMQASRKTEGIQSLLLYYVRPNVERKFSSFLSNCGSCCWICRSILHARNYYQLHGQRHLIRAR